MTARVVVAGEALIDLVARPDGALAPLAGGGPFNTARALGRLGQPTDFIGCVSRDGLGRLLAETLDAEGVRLDERLRTDRPTSLAMAELDEGGAATYGFYLAGTSAEALTPGVALAVAPERASALHVGSLGLVLEPLAASVEALVERWAGEEPLLMVDPNVRPSMIQDFAGYAARLGRIVARAGVVKISGEDLRVLAPDRPPEEAARAMLAQGPKLVLLTLGAEGAVAFGGFGTRRAAAPAVAVVDTIGAGDTFSGAWLARWLELGKPLDDPDAVAEATRFACSAAAVCCSRAGASPPTRAEIETLTGAEPVGRPAGRRV